MSQPGLCSNCLCLWACPAQAPSSYDVTPSFSVSWLNRLVKARQLHCRAGFMHEYCKKLCVSEFADTFTIGTGWEELNRRQLLQEVVDSLAEHAHWQFLRHRITNGNKVASLQYLTGPGPTGEGVNFMPLTARTIGLVEQRRFIAIGQHLVRQRRSGVPAKIILARRRC